MPGLVGELGKMIAVIIVVTQWVWPCWNPSIMGWLSWEGLSWDLSQLQDCPHRGQSAEEAAAPDWSQLRYCVTPSLMSQGRGSSTVAHGVGASVLPAGLIADQPL